jgi:integrase/recombinase XerD
MAQARTLRKRELKQLIDVTASCSRYPQRGVTMRLLSYLCGLRVGEIPSLGFDDVLDDKSRRGALRSTSSL